MRLILGLDAPTSGEVSIDGRAYRDLSAPLHEVGAMLEAHAIHTGRSAYNHLLALAQTHGIPRSRVDEVIELVGLREVARKRVGSFSLGMGQRLGVAAALLGDPATVILDEPANGLDPEGIHWIRTLLKRLAAEGRTVFLSSHLMSEMAQTADHLIVIGRGRLIADTSVAEFVRRASADANVRVRSPQADELRDALPRARVREVTGIGEGLLEVNGLTGEQIGEIALAGTNRDLRAHAAAGLAGGGLHEPHRRVGRVPRRRRRGAERAENVGWPPHERHRDAAPPSRTESRAFTGRVTQWRRAALGVDEAVVAALDALVAAVRVRRDGRPRSLIAAVTMGRWAHLSPHDQATFDPINTASAATIWPSWRSACSGCS